MAEDETGRPAESDLGDEFRQGVSAYQGRMLPRQMNEGVSYEAHVDAPLCGCCARCPVWLRIEDDSFTPWKGQGVFTCLFCSPILLLGLCRFL